MKQINHLYQSEEILQKIISSEEFIELNLLVFLFSDEPIEKIKDIINVLKKLLPNALIAGASSAGSIYNGSSVSESSVITFCQFENIIPKGLLLSLADFSYEGMASEIKDKIINDESKMLFLLGDGMEMNSVELLDKISLSIPNIPLAGGKAATNNPSHENTYIFLNDKIITNGAVAITLNGKHLRVSQNYRLNWKKIGKKMIISEAEGKILRSIDGVPILELFEKYLGREFAKNLPDSSGVEFPFILNRDGVDVARSIAKILPDGSALCHGDIKVGEEVQFSYGNVPIIIDEIEKDYREVIKFRPQGILIFSCIARKNILGSAVDNELLPFNIVAPTSGFFTFGEFFHKENKNFLLNTTMTLLLLSEEPEKELFKEDEFPCLIKYNFENRQLNNVKTLIHLVDQVSTELEEKNTILNKLSYTDSLTGLYNQRFFVETLENEIMRSLRYKKKLSVAILDLDDFKEVNDLYGHSTGDRVLADVAFKIKESCRETDIVCRYGGDEIIVIFTETGIKEAKEVSERISNNVSNLEFLNIKVKTTLSTGIAQLDPLEPENLMKKADERLYKAKKKGKNNIICKD